MCISFTCCEISTNNVVHVHVDVDVEGKIYKIRTLMFGPKPVMPIKSPAADLCHPKLLNARSSVPSLLSRYVIKYHEPSVSIFWKKEKKEEKWFYYTQIKTLL